MAYSTGELASVLLVAVLLSCLGAWAVAVRYRSTMRRLMSAPATAMTRVAVSTPDADPPPPMKMSLADNRRAALRLSLLLIALSALMALSSTALLFVDPTFTQFSVQRWLLLSLENLWPLFPALGLLWRWSRWRLMGTLALWCVLCFGVLLWRSIEPRPLELLLYLAIDIGPPLLLVALLCLGNATRAVAVWLLPPFIGLVWASTVGLHLFAWMVAQHAAPILWLASWLNASVAMLLFALLPWLLAWWPLRWLGRALGRAYARKRLSELMVLFTSVWAISLLCQALTAASAMGLGGLVLVLPVLWIPLVMALVMRLPGKRLGRPPTLLVLRVFQRDDQVQTLFDHVVERWRLSGNTVLIAGTDLATRTLDGEDIFSFLDGRLAERFVRTPADVAPRLAAFDLVPDADGRFRVNECYCHDSTWQDALLALVRHSDVVLMDLRGFQAHNAGCRYELGTLAQTERALRVVVLTDAQTDRAAAAEAIAHGHAERFVWIDTATIDARKRADVLASLFSSANE